MGRQMMANRLIVVRRMAAFAQMGFRRRNGRDQEAARFVFKEDGCWFESEIF